MDFYTFINFDRLRRTNAGISVFGDAVKRRFWFEWHEKEQEFDRKVDN